METYKGQTTPRGEVIYDYRSVNPKAGIAQVILIHQRNRAPHSTQSRTTLPTMTRIINALLQLVILTSLLSSMTTAAPTSEAVSLDLLSEVVSTVTAGKDGLSTEELEKRKSGSSSGRGSGAGASGGGSRGTSLGGVSIGNAIRGAASGSL